MELAGVQPNFRSYTTLMQGFASIGEIGLAFKCLKRVNEVTQKPPIISYASLLKACCKAGRMQNAIAVTEEMAFAGVPMNNYIFNTLLDGYDIFSCTVLKLIYEAF